MHFSAEREALLERLGIPAEAVAARGLREHPEAAELVVADRGASGREHRLEPDAAAAWRSMKAAAAAENVALLIVSAFRSTERQVAIIERHLAAGRGMDDILSVLAPPGFSEHHTGRAIDIGTPGCAPAEPEFEGTAAFRWLTEHAGRFGFVLSYPRDNPLGYRYEPWHWRYEGGKSSGAG